MAHSKSFRKFLDEMLDQAEEFKMENKQLKINEIKAQAYDKIFDLEQEAETENRWTWNETKRLSDIIGETIDKLEDECDWEYGRDY